MRKIATEEHFTTRPLLDALRERNIVSAASVGRAGAALIEASLLDLGERRLADMDKAGITMQVLSVGSGLEDLDAATANSLARDATTNWPRR